MKNLFESVCTDKKIIDDATVIVEQLPSYHRKFITRYSHKDKEFVVAAANAAVKRMDTYSSPTASTPFEYYGNWAIDVKSYSFD